MGNRSLALLKPREDALQHCKPEAWEAGTFIE